MDAIMPLITVALEHPLISIFVILFVIGGVFFDEDDDLLWWYYYWWLDEDN